VLGDLRIDRFAEVAWSRSRVPSSSAPIRRRALRRIVATAFAALAGAARPVPPEAIGDTLADGYSDLHNEELPRLPDAHETFDRRKDLGVKLALITNGVAGQQRAKVVRFALEYRFDHIQIEGEHGFGKPEGAGLQSCDGSARSGPARDVDGRR
jgi:FMN phosphatase YigB (HAD superfamily)